MTSAPSPDPVTGTRVIARLCGEAAGPTLIVIGGLHGNEPSGVEAMRRVAAVIEPAPGRMRGDLVMLAGNVRALERGVRYIDHDLNRGWTGDRLATLRAAEGVQELEAEDYEQLELAEELERALASARGPAYLLDLHATSAEGIPFALCRDAPEVRRFASAFPLTLVLGLLESIDGTLASFLGTHCISLAIEGGQNASPASTRNHEAVIRLALSAAGIAEAGSAASLADDRAVLAASRGELPPVLRVHHRHAIAAEDRFKMEPGYVNIQRIAANELLARDSGGEIRAPGEGFILMPLYQAMGDDGFFLGSEVAAGA